MVSKQLLKTKLTRNAKVVSDDFIFVVLAGGRGSDCPLDNG